MLKRTVVTSVCSLLLLSAVALAQQAGPEPEAKTFVLEFLDTEGDVWGSEAYPTRAAADAALENYRQAYSQLGWGKVNAEVRPEADVVGNKVVKSRDDVTEPFKLRLAKLRESQLQGQWEGLQAESESILGLDERLNKSREAIEQIKREGEIELGNALVEKAVNDAEEAIVDRRTKLEERLTAFEARLRDFNSKRTQLGYGGTYEPDVVSLRQKAGIAVAESADSERQRKETATGESIPTITSGEWKLRTSLRYRGEFEDTGWTYEFRDNGTAIRRLRGRDDRGDIKFPSQAPRWSLKGDALEVTHESFSFTGVVEGDRVKCKYAGGSSFELVR